MTLGIDSTESLSVPESVSESDDRFFQIELESGDYILSSTASAVDGPGESIIYSIVSADHFGENDRFDEVIDVSELDISANEVDAVITSSNVLNVIEDGLVFSRLRGIINALNIELTLSPDN